MDIGVYWSPAVLAHKLERRDRPGRVEEVWNVRHCPKGMGESAGDRLVVACDGRWRGCFRLVPEVLFNPRDPACPYALIFDAKSWTPLADAIPCKPFRGWTYAVPTTLPSTMTASTTSMVAAEAGAGVGHDAATGRRSRSTRGGSGSGRTVGHR